MCVHVRVCVWMCVCVCVCVCVQLQLERLEALERQVRDIDSRTTLDLAVLTQRADQLEREINELDEANVQWCGWFVWDVGRCALCVLRFA